MTALLIFALTLFAAVIVSELAERSVLSTAVLFLIAGFVVGDGVLNLLPIKPTDPIVTNIANVALLSVLFTDGMRVGVRDLTEAWHLPGRALLLGMPLTMIITAVFAHFVAGLPWLEAGLIGAVLSPTDPVFAAAIIGRQEIPQRLRHLLNVESGVNDGLALPVVLAFLAMLGGVKTGTGELLLELAGGIALGVAVPWLAGLLVRRHMRIVASSYEPLYGVAVGLVVVSIAKLVHANEYLAAFSAGMTLASVTPTARETFKHFGETFAELAKLAALLVFGALISPRFLGETSLAGYGFGALALFVARPAALLVALDGSALGWRERLVAAWFGPKGFASVVYGLLALYSIGGARGEEVFHLIALTIALSILAHSSTDVPVARWFRQRAASLPDSSTE
jgi:NhaP-type Na+/H+ or K+/H+ antiporter